MKLESTIKLRPDFLYIAPLLNVVMLLMVYFMLNSSLIVRSGVRVDLPVSGSSLKLIERAHVVTITGDAIPRVLLNNEEIAIGDLAAKLAALKKESRYVLINQDSNASHGLWQRVVNEIHAAGCDPVSGTRPAGE
jgi:biopolymer transport protein ExbD